LSRNDRPVASTVVGHIVGFDGVDLWALNLTISKLLILVLSRGQTTNSRSIPSTTFFWRWLRLSQEPQFSLINPMQKSKAQTMTGQVQDVCAFSICDCLISTSACLSTNATRFRICVSAFVSSWRRRQMLFTRGRSASNPAMKSRNND
jgi:hypothetical protein